MMKIKIELKDTITIKDAICKICGGFFFKDITGKTPKYVCNCNNPLNDKGVSRRGNA